MVEPMFLANFPPKNVPEKIIGRNLSHVTSKSTNKYDQYPPPLPHLFRIYQGTTPPPPFHASAMYWLC